MDRRDNIAVWARLTTAQHALSTATLHADGLLQANIIKCHLAVRQMLDDLIKADKKLAQAVKAGVKPNENYPL